MKSICIVGLNTSSIITALSYANHGLHVVLVEENVSDIKRWLSPQLPIYTTEIKDQWRKVIDLGLLTIQTEPKYSNCFIISSPIPIQEDQSIQLDFLISAVTKITPYLKIGDLVTIESIIPPYTIERTIVPLLQESNLILGKEVHICYSPFVYNEDLSIDDNLKIPRIIGGITEDSCLVGKRWYELIYKGPIKTSPILQAELSYLTVDAFETIQQAFIHELLKINDLLHVSIYDTLDQINHLKQWNMVLNYCIPNSTSPLLLKDLSDKLTPLTQTAHSINEGMPLYMVKKIQSLLIEKEGTVPKVALLGLDLKESHPIYTILQYLRNYQINFKVYDSNVYELQVKEQVNQVDELLEDADLIVILKKRDFLKNIVFDDYLDRIRNLSILDLVDSIPLENRKNFQYYTLGMDNYVGYKN